jgi:hypothetical protein
MQSFGVSETSKRACSMRVLPLILGSAFALWAADPVLGTWELIVAKSKYNPGPAPKSQTRIYEVLPDGMKVTIKTVDADGRSSVVVHPANYDGKDYPITGSTQADVIALKQIDTYTSEAILKHAGQILATSRRVVSTDGKSMTVTYKGIDSRGRQVDSVAVYERR